MNLYPVCFSRFFFFFLLVFPNALGVSNPSIHAVVVISFSFFLNKLLASS